MIQTKPSKLSPKLALGWGLPWTLGLFAWALRPIEDFDTFWQLKSGEYIWMTGEFLYRDTFSLAADVYRMEHCWLHDLVFYAAHSLGGYPLLTLLKPVVIALCGYLLYRWNLRRGGEPAFVLPVLLLCLAASAPSWTLRPQLWTFLFSLLYLHLLHRGREEGLRAWLWLAPVMLLWANLHAGCVFGLVMIGLFGCGELLRRLGGKGSWRRLGQLAVAGLAAFGAAFLNPYGYRIPVGQLLGHLKQHKVAAGEAPVTMVGNMEWLPPSFDQVPLFYVVFALWAFFLVLRVRRLDPAEAIFFLAFLYMGLNQIRHTTLVSMLAAFYLPLALQQVAGPLLRRAPRLAGSLPAATLVLLAVLVAGRAWSGELGWGLKKGVFPVAAADFVLERKLPANLYNSYDWGGYLIWRLYPEYRVFLDSRQTSSEHFVASNVIDNRQPGWQATLERYGVETVVTRTCYYDTGEPLPLVDGLVQDPGWALIFQDETALVFLKATEEIRPLAEGLALPKRRAYLTMQAEARRLLAADSRRSLVHLALGRAALHLGERREAMEYFREHLRRHPGDAGTRELVKLLEGWGH